LASDWTGRFPIVVATEAPEITRGLDTIRALAAHRCRVQVGQHAGHGVEEMGEAGTAAGEGVADLVA
jgi:hypothetical protein